MKLAEKIKEIRQVLRLNQNTFAEIFGVNQRTVSNWEAGRNEPGWDVVSTLVDKYHVSPEWLFGENNDISPFKQEQMDRYQSANGATPSQCRLDDQFDNLAATSKKTQIYECISNILSAEYEMIVDGKGRDEYTALEAMLECLAIKFARFDKNIRLALAYSVKLPLFIDYLCADMDQEKIYNELRDDAQLVALLGDGVSIEYFLEYMKSLAANGFFCKLELQTLLSDSIFCGFPMLELISITNLEKVEKSFEDSIKYYASEIEKLSLSNKSIGELERLHQKIKLVMAATNNLHKLMLLTVPK